MDASREIEDPTDWLNTSLSGFLPLDNALRCQVCKDLYDTPMITSCSHTFCSKCIRTCISNDGKCPTCRAAEQASKLRNNFAIDEAVGAFKMARPEAYKIALKDKQDGMEEPRRPGKRRRVVREEGEGEEQVDVARRQTRSMRSNDSRRTAVSTQTDGVVDIEDSEDDDEYVPEDGLVACPICSTRMKEQDVSPHLDGECDGTKKEDKVPRKSRTPLKTQQKPSSNHGNPLPRQPSQSSPLERLAELNYTLLNDSQLRKKFSALGIPSTGRKDQLKDRYTAWANIWNANCDSRHPKSKPELLNELRKWERTQGGQAREVDGAGIMKKDFDAGAWQMSNKDDFSKLIEQARKKKTRAQDAGERADQGEKEKLSTENETSGSPSPKENGHASEPTDQDKDTYADANGTQPQSPDAYHPYQNNSEALASIREKVSALSANEHVEPVMNAGFKMADVLARTEDATPPQSSQRTASSSNAPTSRPRPHHPPHHPPPAALLKQASSLGEHFADTQDTRQLDMFRVPEDPVSDCEEAH